MYEKNEDGILGLNSLNSIVPEDLPKVEAAVELLFSQPERSVVLDIRKPLSDGTIANTLWDFACIMNAKGEPVEIQCIGIDETDRYQATRHLEQTTNLLNEAQFIANIGAWEHDLYTGKAFWTDEVYNIHEVNKDFDHNAINAIEFYHPDDRPLISQAIEDSISKQTSFDLICRFITAKGNRIWVRSSGHPVKSNGKTTHIIGVIQDITKQKNTETLLQNKNEELNRINKELIAAKEKAEESDRLKSAFLANMSHEIRTPMNGILGFTELLLEPNLGCEEQEEYIQIVHKSGQRLLNTVNDIVEISKIETGLVKLNLEEVNIYDSIEELFHFFKPETLKKKLKLNLELLLPEKKKSVLTDRNKLDSILTNIIKNAIKYTESGKITIGCLAKGNTIEFYIKDTGIGIPLNKFQSIFNRFEQADSEDKKALEGSGLGLSIAKSYVEMLGGKIWVESEKGKGSTFFFTIPFSLGTKQTANALSTLTSEKIETSTVSDISNLKVLIVEDDEISQKIISKQIENLTRQIIKVTSGIEAIEVCRKNPDINLILMDINMTGMNGDEATRIIREFNKEVVIIAQTANALPEDRERFTKGGLFDDYIPKPIKKQELETLIYKYF